jgi:hypothetical protein
MPKINFSFMTRHRSDIQHTSGRTLDAASLIILTSLSTATYAQTEAHQRTSHAGHITANEFNPVISLILNGSYARVDETELTLPGFQLGGEAGLPSEGFSLGHSELALSANIDDKFYGSSYFGIVYEDGETEVELEEAFLETLALGNGFTIKGGRFYSGIGYLNAVHDHAHDFADRPLVYDALMGGHLVDTGIQAGWTAPTSMYLHIGTEITSGTEYPSGAQDQKDTARALFAKIGADLNEASSWQLGISYFDATFDQREAGAHHGHGGGHGGAESDVDNELLAGEVSLAGIDFVYKWTPNGNLRQENLTLQAEYFVREEKATAKFVEGINSAEANHDGEQTGWYAQAIYQFKPAWRVGLRFDALSADTVISDFENNGIDEDEFLEESGLGVASDPKRITFMMDYSPSHFSRLRFQYGKLDNGTTENRNEIFLVQYLMSIGSHGAHSF